MHYFTIKPNVLLNMLSSIDIYSLSKFKIKNCVLVLLSFSFLISTLISEVHPSDFLMIKRYVLHIYYGCEPLQPSFSWKGTCSTHNFFSKITLHLSNISILMKAGNIPRITLKWGYINKIKINTQIKLIHIILFHECKQTLTP